MRSDRQAQGRLLHCATHDEVVGGFGRDDAVFWSVKVGRTGKATSRFPFDFAQGRLFGNDNQKINSRSRRWANLNFGATKVAYKPCTFPSSYGVS